MNASDSNLELNSVPRNHFDGDPEAHKGDLTQSIHSRTQDFLLENDSIHASFPVDHSGQNAPPFPNQRRTRQWRSIANHSSACCFVSGVIVALTIVPLLGLPYSYSGTEVPSFGFCEPDGTFNTGLESVSIWSPSKAFQITLGFGSISFSTAKFIDIIWDVAVGRGVQAILGFVMYRAFTKCLARVMERSAVSFDTFESVTLQGSSMRALVNLIRDYFTNRGLRAKLAVSWMILALSYVLVFPTLMSAMTGYSATTKAYIQAPDGSQVEWSSFRLINYIIYDGWRIGLTGSYLVTAVSRYESADPSQSPDANVCAHYSLLYGGSLLPGDPKDGQKCLLTKAVSQYVQTSGFHGTNYTSSTFSPNSSTVFNLTSPTLNISAFYIDPFSSLFGTALTVPYGTPPPAAFNNASLARFARIDQPDNRTYDIPYIRENGRCQQQNTYQWGFSFLLLFIALLLSTLWALGMWAMWLDAYYNSKIDAASKRDMGSWRAVIDLADGIAGSLNSHIPGGQNTSADMIAGMRGLGDSEIRRWVRRKAEHGRIGYMDLCGPDKPVITRSAQLRRSLEMKGWGRWLLRRKGWVIAGVAVGLLLIGVVAGEYTTQIN